MSAPASVLGALAASQATDFTIIVLEGPLSTSVFRPGDAPGILNLRGREMPFRAPNFYKLGGVQRVKTTYYPGTDEATQQLMGPQENNTIISGGWHDRFLGNAGAHRLALIFDNLRRLGSQVEVRWGQSADPSITSDANQDEVRQGLIKRFEATWERPQDINWECEFEWRGRGEPFQSPLLASQLLNPRESVVDLTAKLDDATDAIQAYREDPFNVIGNLTFGVNLKIDKALDQIASCTEILTFVSADAESVQNLPNDAIERLKGAAINAVGALATLEAQVLGMNLATITVDDLALHRLSLQQTTFDTLRSVGVAREQAALQAASLDGLTTPDVIGEVRPVPGTDLRDIATEFYGDPDAWIIIARFNGLVSSSVPGSTTGPSDNPGSPIRIPRQSAVLAMLPC